MLALPVALVVNLASGAPPLRGPDFDGDGREDAAVSAVQKSVDGDGDDGAVFLLYGTSTGLQSAAGKTDQIDLSVSGASAPDFPAANFGAEIAWGDFDGDCYDDLVVAAVREGVANDDHAVAIYRGGPQGPDPADAVFMTQLDNPSGDDPGRYGGSLAVGDFDADGQADLAIGAWGLNGQVDVHYGGSDPHPSQLFDDAHPDIDDDVDDAVYNFGWTTAAGDFNCDGYDDLAMSYGAGMAVAYGSSQGLDGSGAWPLVQLDYTTPGLATEVGALRRLNAMVVGNFNDDQAGEHACEDLVGTMTDGNWPQEGALVAMYGTATEGLQALSPSDDVIMASSLGLSDSTTFDDAITVGRFDGDAFDDVAVSGGGAVHIVRGSSNGLITSFSASWERGEELPGTGGIGQGLGSGNYDGDADGMHDLVLGAPYTRLGSLSEAGVIFTVITDYDILPTIASFAAFTSDDLGSPSAAYDHLGGRSLTPRRVEVCGDGVGGVGIGGLQD